MLTEYDVFISYSSLDADWVKDWLLPRLESAGLTVCIDLRDFDIGVPSLTNMENAVERSRKTLLVLTPNWIKSEWTNFESLLVQTDDPSGVRQRTLPLLLEKCERPKRLGILSYADFTDKTQWDAQLARVISAITGEPTSQPASKSILQPNLVHPYPLQANFTGRVKERDELTAWLADDEHPIYELVAMGGMGKSALTWYWLTRDIITSSKTKLDGVMWWSFYEGESSFARFVDEALKYVGGQATIDAERFPTTYDRAQELRQQLQAKRILFVLDGFERQLRDYASLDAAYKSDERARLSRDGRSCVDPITSRLLRDIPSASTRAKVLLTTRLPVSDLEDRAGDALSGVFERELKELSREDSITFMQAQGVTKGTPTEIANVCENYGNHPLSMRLLSGLIRHDAKMPGDIKAAPSHDVHDDLVQRQHHVLERSYSILRKRERAILSRIAAFRGPMAYEVLEIFRNPGEGVRFEAALDDLRVRGLLQRDTEHNRYDLHPIVRHYAYDRLADKKGIHMRLRDYFDKIPGPAIKNITSIKDLSSLIELYHHTVHAQRYDDAAKLFHDRIHDCLYYLLGAYHIQIELLRALFPDGEDHPPRLDDEDARALMQNALANSYSLSGNPRRAVPLYEQNRIIREKQGVKTKIGAALIAMASAAYFLLGELSVVDQNLRRGIQLCQDAGGVEWESSGHEELARLLAYRGEFEESIKESNLASIVLTKGSKLPFHDAYERICSAIRLILMNNPREAFEAAAEARTLANEARFEMGIVRSESLMGKALVMMQLGNTDLEKLKTAAQHLTDALTRCRRMNLVECEPDILLSWARWHQAQTNFGPAIKHAEEGLAIADRCQFRLSQADIHNFLARLALDAGKRDEARKEAEIAKERAWCDGPPHCYKPALDDAEKMLAELGAVN